jgi:UDP-N-acetylglucosamine acyltransferase
MSPRVHPLAAVESGVELGDGVAVGPFCVVEAGARIGARTVLRSHVVVSGCAELGEDNVVYPHTTLGLEPQDLKYKGEPTRLVVGHRNTIRENCTLHRGTADGGGITTLGSGNLMQVGAHVAHDCHVGDDNVLGHQSSLAGHVTVGSSCIVGAYSAVHQFCRVGDHAFIGGDTIVTMDALPYMKTVGPRETKSYGVNLVGLQRKGFTKEVMEALKRANHLLFLAGHLREEALALAQEEVGGVPEVAYLLDFIRSAQRGVHRS